jgi:hypothetical protein
MLVVRVLTVVAPGSHAGTHARCHQAGRDQQDEQDRKEHVTGVMPVVGHGQFVGGFLLRHCLRRSAVCGVNSPTSVGRRH